MRNKRGRIAVFFTFTLLALVLGVAVFAGPASRDDLLKRADQRFEEKNYKDAAQDYEVFLAQYPKDQMWRHASEHVILCKSRLTLFDDALGAAEKYVERTRNTPYEAVAERLTGNLYMLIPHWGTRAGGVFHRAQWKEGIQLQSYRYDKKRALEHMERARDLYEKYEGDAKALGVLPEKERQGWRDERLECLFDLANICARFGIYENQWTFWYSFWGERDEFMAETAGEQDFDEYYNSWQLQRKRPIGLRVGPDGKPIFPTAPEKYAKNLADDQKILFLLDEIRKLDRSETKEFAGKSWYRQGMLARTRFGMDRLNGYASIYYDGAKYPLQEELKSFNPWELKDKEAVVLAGGRLCKAELPPQWDVLSLLRTSGGDYPRSSVADAAQYSVGLYYQSRQQYIAAIAQYEKLRAALPKSPWSTQASQEIALIRRPEAMISQTGIQLSGDPTRLQLSYRNLKKVHFAAYEINHEGLMEELRSERPDPDKGMRFFYSISGWHGFFVHGYRPDNWQQAFAAKYVGKLAARWSDEVADDGSHRYAQTTLQTPLKDRGAYLVIAFTSEPTEASLDKKGSEILQMGASRAVYALNDLAMVEKKAEKGNLYFICDARSGAPVAGAALSILEIWNEWNQVTRRNIYHRQMHELKTDADGLALFGASNKHGGNLHVLVRAGKGRLAWSGMSYWGNYQPSAIRSGLFAYCITDRPVYRPAQTVRFKVWLRKMQNGIYENLPSRKVSLTVFDPRGNKACTVGKFTDDFGGIDSEFTLGEEAPLGVYRLTVNDENYIGGQNFRVEEYKKPEFEVTVEPGKTHAKLGEKITAVIKATYYFGAPVTEANVKYRVFREEYTHGYYFPGPWDWLYGAGYGWAWYESDWFPWWGKMRCCWLPPAWWGPARSPVRELAQQGESPIGKDGTVSIEIDTAAALRDHPDRDHQYIIEADVGDASRRVISGEGAVKATRQAYYTFIGSDRGYYRPGEEMVIRIRCLSPDNTPIQTEGMVTVSSVVFGGADNARIEEKELKSWKASTDADGQLEFRLREEKSGQLRISFVSPDAWGGKVEGYGLVWVCGRDFDGRLYRFNDIEIITDKRSYEPGETAHVMLNTRAAPSYVLFSDEVDNNTLLKWRLIRVENRSTIVDIPIRREHQPNFFVEATTVNSARVHQQSVRICVPPEQAVVKLDLSADKAQYKPGEKATLKLTARTLDGKPARAQVALSVFDKSVLYIQSEYAPPIAKFFHGNLRYHSVQMTTNLYEQFSAWGDIQHPYQQLYPLPPDWFGVWGPSISDWRTISSEELKNLEGEAGTARDGMGFGGGRGGRRRGAGLEEQAADRADASFAMAAPGAPMEAAKAAGGVAGDKRKGEAEAPAEAAFAEAAVRQKFADTALWIAALTTDADGVATASVEMPENLTTWKINAWAMTADTRVGQADTSAVTTKNLLVRLQAPRFFVERDEVVLSANVHNYLKSEKTARVSIELPAQVMKLTDLATATRDVKVPAGAETRVDWRVQVLKEGRAEITVKALTDEESDAMKMSFPVLVHGILKQVAATGSMRPDETNKTATVTLEVPKERRPELTRLEVQFAPSLAGAMLDALPYCIDYPYGCTEQTMSRFLPCVLTLKTLRNMGVSLEEVRNMRGRLDEVRRMEQGQHISYYWMNPVFDQAELDRMIAKSLARITEMQHGDGGWGWWKDDSSSAYLTSYVLYALCTAVDCDVKVDENMVRRGMQFLQNWEAAEMVKDYWRSNSEHAFAAQVLSMRKLKAACKPAKDDKRPGDLIERLWTGRDQLELYGKALLAITMANLDDAARAKTVLENIMQYKEENPETEVAWFRTASSGWWYWWNSDIESNATVLRAIVRIDPKSEVAPRLVKWLLNNRKNGYYWRSTRDTTLCVAAMSEFASASGESKPDYTLTLDLDNGAVIKKVKISRDNFFTYDNRFVVEGVTLTEGTHTLKITKEGAGALYFNSYLRYFTKEEGIKAAGHELKVNRTYYKLVQIPYEVEVEGSQGQKVVEKRLRYNRVALKDGDALKSGELVQVELKVASDNDYTFLCFEDMKPAGCEAVELQSGGKMQEGFASYMELRDEKVVFFLNSLGQGEHLMRYRLRAEVPGVFHALPTTLYGMYVPELRANADEMILKVED